MDRKKSYGLATMIAMMVGVVVGSGIYFRADDILRFTQGNLLMGVLVLALGSFTIIFGSLALSKLSKEASSELQGGLIAYFEQCAGSKVGAGFGWFQLFVYFPAIAVIIAEAGAMYTFMLFGMEANRLMKIGLALLYLFILLGTNTLHRVVGGYLQNLSTALKLLPLILMAFAGIFLTEPMTMAEIGVKDVQPLLLSGSWLSALIPLTYSYDGWTIALNIAGEVRNPRKNVARALVISPIMILLIYILYFYGLASILGSETILELGDEAIFVAAKQLLGNRMGNVVLVIIIISVLGVANGVILGAIRLPQAMAARGMLPDHGLSKISETYRISIRSALLVGILFLVWTVIHLLISTFHWLGGHDVSEISIVFNYLCYMLLYAQLIRIGAQKHKTSYLIIGCLAILGSLMILVGSLVMNPVYISLFLVACAVVMLAGMRYAHPLSRP